MLKASIIGLLILLILIIVYQFYKISEGFVGEPRITAVPKRNGKYIDIIAKTTDRSTIRGVNILYNYSIPVLPAGGSTDSSLDLNLVVSPTEFPIANELANNMKEGHKYYFVQSPVTKYTEGVTPLLGSFVYRAPAGETSNSSSITTQATTQPSIPTLPSISENSIPISPPSTPPSTPPSPVVPQVAPPAQPTATVVTPAVVPQSQEAAIAKEKQSKAELLRDIQQVVRSELLQQQKLTTASSQPVLRAGANGDILMSPATAQGQELSTARDKICPKNMNDYIRKDSIPCWNCTLDY
jgi:hypothetical protein